MDVPILTNVEKIDSMGEFYINNSFCVYSRLRIISTVVSKFKSNISFLGVNIGGKVFIVINEHPAINAIGDCCIKLEGNPVPFVVYPILLRLQKKREKSHKNFYIYGIRFL